MLSRNGADITRTFPEITAALHASGRSVVLDGEVVALDETGAPSFSRLQQRWPQNRRPSAELLGKSLLASMPSMFSSFDGKNITRRPYRERREALEELAAESRCRTVQFPRNWTDTDPAVVLEAAAELNLEGIVGKHPRLALQTRRPVRIGLRRRFVAAASSSLVAGCRASARAITRLVAYCWVRIARTGGCSSAESSEPGSPPGIAAS
jgi:hypothetical protein